jgi:DNA-binding LacI/PurR family transcriptional regulator
VVTREQEGAFSAVQHLLRLGHEDILFINAPGYISSAAERHAGLQRAYREAGREHKPDLVRTCPPSMDSAYNVMQRVLVEGTHFTAVFGFCDLMILGVVKALREVVRKIPEDVSLVGFDDIDFVSLITPPLTTIHQHKYELGTEGARMLLRSLRGEPGVRQIELPTELIVRQSTAKARD